MNCTQYDESSSFTSWLDLGDPDAPMGTQHVDMMRGVLLQSNPNLDAFGWPSPHCVLEAADVNADGVVSAPMGLQISPADVDAEIDRAFLVGIRSALTLADAPLRRWDLSSGSPIFVNPHIRPLQPQILSTLPKVMSATMSFFSIAFGVWETLAAVELLEISHYSGLQVLGVKCCGCEAEKQIIQILTRTRIGVISLNSGPLVTVKGGP